MTDSKWKLVVNREGVTITGDRFQLTAANQQAADTDLLDADVDMAVMDPAAIDGIINELQSINRRTYGQFCGLSHAAEMVGERWGMLIIRDLLVGPKRFSELSEGLPLLSPDILSARLKEMEHFGVLRAKASSVEEGVVRYELTEYGQELDDIVRAFGRWGARTLDVPRPDEIVTINGLIMALRSCFRGAAVADIAMTFELTAGPMVVNGTIADGEITVVEGPNPDADLRIEPGMMAKDILTGQADGDAVRASDEVSYSGDDKLVDDFARAFSLNQ
ncbi:MULTISPECIES: winged helix-turn-helix transcriptional regulator [Actinokineospora]|uniref:HxlR family transcriptional regulator n=1 Tax=Actinokineospora fastidiosa TaxID=1816 RepID=A0A918GF04_9PSEU|nr:MULTISPECIES: helix-turn-helix domain-containing protein [Actinokineospora]UVS79997.1 HTH-type transcriptional regulator YodB [Actinokineospora sp. UTMC 2448]GGS32371.1 HxlR family transcriptional regulator [Actinokineospora fastidiosa]